MTFDANSLRLAFTHYFVEHGHQSLPAAPLIPHDPSVLFTIAGMVQFKPYFLGEQTPPTTRATTVQPCFRMVDIDLVGTTSRHATIFEMLGNFSFGDYFKEQAIPFAWELVTEVLGFEKDRLWITVHESDEDASDIWHELAGVPLDRIQKMGEDNFWRMGETGPCGPCSEIYFDRGAPFGDDGGPARGSENRFIEIWNLVFMQYERSPDGSLSDLPRRNIDTGAGLERMLALLQNVDSVFDTDHIRPIVDEASRLTGHRMGQSPSSDVALRILADHARAMTMLISDGVFPSNEGRGYTLRRIIRRAVMRAYQLGVEDLVTPELVSRVVSTLKAAYPKLERNESFVQTIVAHEEEAFRRTLRSGTQLIESELDSGADRITGDVAFKLHDTFGFPIDLTVEFARDRGISVDREEFDLAMSEQRNRAREAGKLSGGVTDTSEKWRAIGSEHGLTRFVGYNETRVSAEVRAVVDHEDSAEFTNYEGEQPPRDCPLLDVVLNITPFYAEGGGQIGDSGVIGSGGAVMRVLDTTRVGDGIIRHTGYMMSGAFAVGEEVVAEIDASRRAAIRRNHTATHLLQDALRRVLGGHVTQQGSLVAPDRLRFDYSHFGPLNEDERASIELSVNMAILDDAEVRTYETSRREAEESGAIAFFGEKYGDVVRVVEAGVSSIELCGGTHVDALGMIGPFRVISEASIGANTRRIEAVTGVVALEESARDRVLIERLSRTLRTIPTELEPSLDRFLERQRLIEEENHALKAARLVDEAKTRAGDAVRGALVFRRDGIDANAIRDLALAIRTKGVSRVAVIGTPDGDKVALVVALESGTGLDAKAVAIEAAKQVGGGGGGTSDLATAGGRDATRIDDALGVLDRMLRVEP